MALISSSTLIRILSIFHITIAYYFLTSPQTIADQNLVFILGEGMKIPAISSFSVPSAPLAFCSLVLALFGLSDFVSATSLAGADAYEGGLSTAYWSSQALVRLLFFFGISGYVYIGRPEHGAHLGDIGMEAEDLAGGLMGAEKTGTDLIKNSVVFTWAFLEMLLWFWIFLTLRDERREAAIKIAAKMKRAEEEALLKTD